ncbi:MAG: hypothetical protein R2834_20395 [Rhodothermales bacterium]
MSNTSLLDGRMQSFWHHMVIPNPLSAIANLIESVVQREDEALEALVDKGIFFMPESAFAFEVGNEILRQRHTPFSATTQ